MADFGKLLLTGATGFVGQHLLLSLKERFELTIVSRNSVEIDSPVNVVIGDLCSIDEWSSILTGLDVVVHLAAQISPSQDNDELESYRHVNVDATLNLARQAVDAGVKRFIFLSSAKVNGEQTFQNPFTEDDPPQPEDIYGQTKCEAEEGLRQIADETGLEVVIIRPPLVYGPGVKGNFASLIRFLDKGIPLPLGAIDNQRSLIGIDNLVNFIEICIQHPAAANQTFLISDGEDLSTTELLRRLGAAMGKPARLIPVPASIMAFVAKIFGKEAVSQRLLGSLQVDISKARELLEWSPPVSVDEGLRRCVVKRSSQTQPHATGLILRWCDVAFSALGLLACLPFFAVIMVLGWFDTGSPLFFQERVGRGRQPFTLVKFRTMKPDTASVASHLASASSITKLGLFLRKTKLDELPQLWNVLKGEMSLVGPRPCLFNQQELIEERDARGVFRARPGITGLAQVNEIDMSTPVLLAETDQKMLQALTIKDYFRYILMTVSGKGSGDRVVR